MNCRQVSKLMPEMAAGELDPQQEARAREHVRSCTHCARELAHYEEALGAMSQPWEMLEIPEDLDLVLPENVRRPVRLTRLVPALGLALIMALALTTLPRHERPAGDISKPVAVTIPKEQLVVKKDMPVERELAMNADVPDIYKKPKHVKPARLKNHKRHRHLAERNMPKTTVTHDTPAPATTSDTDTAPAAEPLPTVIVIASTVPESELPEIYIHSVNESTGEVTIQNIITDENGSIRESEVSYKAAGKNYWRDSL